MRKKKCFFCHIWGFWSVDVSISSFELLYFNLILGVMETQARVSQAGVTHSEDTAEILKLQLEEKKRNLLSQHNQTHESVCGWMDAQTAQQPPVKQRSVLSVCASPAAARRTHTQNTTCNTKTLFCEILTQNELWNTNTTQVNSHIWPFDLDCFEPVKNQSLMGFELIILLQGSGDLLLLGKTQCDMSIWCPGRRSEQTDPLTAQVAAQHTQTWTLFSLWTISSGKDPTWCLSVNGINFYT